jgi:hypothetical protein
MLDIYTVKLYLVYPTFWEFDLTPVLKLEAVPMIYSEVSYLLIIVVIIIIIYKV